MTPSAAELIEAAGAPLYPARTLGRTASSAFDRWVERFFIGGSRVAGALAQGTVQVPRCTQPELPLGSLACRYTDFAPLKVRNNRLMLNITEVPDVVITV
jgi:hypothetical protein